MFSNNNHDERFRFLSEAFFAKTHEQLREVDRQVQKSKELLIRLTRYGTYKQFADDSGQMSWAKLVAKLNGTAMDI